MTNILEKQNCQTTIKYRRASGNKGYTTMRGAVLRRTVCARFNICASYEHLWLESRTACSPETLPETL